MATKSLNSNNTSGVNGVYYHKSKNKWQAKIGYGGRSIHIGYYDELEDAIQARRDAEYKYYGEMAKIRFNYPEEDDKNGENIS